MGGAEQAGAGGGAAKDTGPRTGATERDDTAAMPTVVGRSDQLASAVDRFTECLLSLSRQIIGNRVLRAFGGLTDKRLISKCRAGPPRRSTDPSINKATI